MTLGTTAGILAASLCLAAAPLAGWAAECTDRKCSCFGDEDCLALFDSGQCQVGTEVKSTTEMVSLCGVETKRIVLGSCQQAPSFRNTDISAHAGEAVPKFPHLSKSCGG